MGNTRTRRLETISLILMKEVQLTPSSYTVIKKLMKLASLRLPASRLKRRTGEHSKTNTSGLWVTYKRKKIEYIMSTPQMKIIQLLSYSVRQNFTYHCKDSFAFKDNNGKLYSNPKNQG